MNDIYKQKYIKYKSKYINLTKQLNDESRDTLEYLDWIKYAEDNKLLFGPKDYIKMDVGKKYYATQVDYIRFLSIEYPKEYNIEFNKVYDPVELFSN